jgi:hypothetical protein
VLLAARCCITMDVVEDSSVLIDSSLVDAPVDGGVVEQEASYPSHTFAQLSAQDMNDPRNELRKIPVPPHRMTPLRNRWLELCNPIVTHLKLQIRMNTHTRNVEIKVCGRNNNPNNPNNNNDNNMTAAIVVGAMCLYSVFVASIDLGAH